MNDKKHRFTERIVDSIYEMSDAEVLEESTETYSDANDRIASARRTMIKAAGLVADSQKISPKAPDKFSLNEV